MFEEAGIVNEILDFVNKEGHGKAVKVHGSVFTERGTPDIFGSIHMLWNPNLSDFQKAPGFITVYFLVEVKVPGEEPEKIQQHRLEEWAEYGWFRTACVHSLQEFKEFLVAAMHDDSNRGTSELLDKKYARAKIWNPAEE